MASSNNRKTNSMSSSVVFSILYSRSMLFGFLLHLKFFIALVITFFFQGCFAIFHCFQQAASVVVNLLRHAAEIIPKRLELTQHIDSFLCKRKHSHASICFA